MKEMERKKYSISQSEQDRKELDAKWDRIDQSIKESDANYVKPNIPFKSDALIRNFNSLYAKIYDKEKYVNL